MFSEERGILSPVEGLLRRSCPRKFKDLAAVYAVANRQLPLEFATKFATEGPRTTLVRDIAPSPGHSLCESKAMATRRSSAAPERSSQTATYAVVRDANVRDGNFNFGRILGTAMISLLTALIGTGVVSMINLYARVGAIADSVARTQTQLDRQVEHSVDREEYLRRDREIQRALERMATKDELRDVNDTLRSIQESISPRRR
jgi:hypothetical protein